MTVRLLPLDKKHPSYGPYVCLRAQFDGREFRGELRSGHTILVPVRERYLLVVEDVDG